MNEHVVGDRVLITHGPRQGQAGVVTRVLLWERLYAVSVDGVVELCCAAELSS